MSTLLMSFASFALALMPSSGQAPQPPQATVASVAVTSAPPVVEIDLRRLKGPLVRQLAWSPDHAELYLQTYEANRDASVRNTFHYVIPAVGGAPRQVETPPSWAVSYFQWKSGQASPDDPSWKITVSTEKKIESATSIPMGGDMARGGTGGDPTSGISAESVANAAAQSGNVNVYSMRLGQEIIGYWENHPIVPGLTFGWSPKGVGLIAFVDMSGKLAVMDRTGTVRRIDSTKAVTLPAWSLDGTKLAYLEKTGRTTYALVIATIGR
jgi:hypothetical protein